MEDFLEKVGKIVYKRSREDCMKDEICIKCGKTAKHFVDDVSKKEYTLSGFCQICQDDFFK